MKELNDIINGRVNCKNESYNCELYQERSKEAIEILIDNEKMYTVTDTYVNVIGSIRGTKKNNSYTLMINNEEAKLAENFTFSIDAKLLEGTNFIDLVLYENEEAVKRECITVYRKIKGFKDKEVVLWVEQFPNAKNFHCVEDIENMMLTAQKAGITAFGIDIKGPEGYVSYRKNDLSSSPYISEISHPKKSGVSKDFDLLEEFITMAHKHKMKVFASINVFVEGNLILGETAFLKNHPDWEEIVQRPEDKGALLPISKSSFDKKILSFVNPANEEVQLLQLKRFEEVLKNYQVDGVNLDRCRYDNMYSDFSETTREKFEDFLTVRNLKINSWPDDIYKIEEDGSLVKGSLYNYWWLFRSSLIKDFAAKVRALVDMYSELKGEKILLSAYVGSWYEHLYQNGINWASPNFKYDSRLAFPEENIYTKEYAETGYTDLLDFIMIGTYYETAEEINKYITLGNIITNGELSIYAGMALTEIPDAGVQREVFQAALNNCNGLMLFDLCYTNWPVQEAALKNTKI